MRLRRYKRPRYLWHSYLGTPLACPPSCLPCFPPATGHGRPWQSTDRQACSPATRLLAFVLSKWAILEWTATAHTTVIIISVRLPTSPTCPLSSVPPSDQTSSKQSSCPCLTAPKHLSKIHTTLQPTPNQPQPTITHNRLSTVCPSHNRANSLVNRKAPSTTPTLSNASNTTHFRNGRRQHNVLSGAAPLAAASLPRPTTKPPSASPAQAELNGLQVEHLRHLTTDTYP